MILLAINWSVVGTQVGYLILALSILVIPHELGHFIPAKLFGCRVEKFYLFFDAWFSLFKKKIGNTIYGIGWLPLGGYVKISGMIDESMDTDQMKQPPQPWEFRSKPAWQRLIIMLGGVTMNILVAIFIYIMILFFRGEQKLPNANVKNGISITDSLGYKIGLKNGDKILAVNDKPIAYFNDITAKLLVGDRVTVERDGKIETFNLPVDLLGSLAEKKRGSLLFEPRLPVIVDVVPDTSNAKKAGLQRMDKIIAIDSVPTPYYDIYKTVVNEKKGKTVQLTVERNGRDTVLTAGLSQEGTLGFYRISSFQDLDSLGIYKLEHKKYGFFEAFPAGVRLAINNVESYLTQIKKLFSPKTGAYKGLGGFKTIGSVMPEQWGDWQAFWSIVAFLCIVIAFTNLLPIPALDGGHILFTLFEMITGRKPSDKFLQYAQVVGMAILLLLMIYANGNDWFGWNKGR